MESDIYYRFDTSDGNKSVTITGKMPDNIQIIASPGVLDFAHPTIMDMVKGLLSCIMHNDERAGQVPVGNRLPSFMLSREKHDYIGVSLPDIDVKSPGFVDGKHDGIIDGYNGFYYYMDEKDNSKEYRVGYAFGHAVGKLSREREEL